MVKLPTFVLALTPNAGLALAPPVYLALLVAFGLSEFGLR